MKIIFNALPLFFLLFSFSSCLKDDSVEPAIIIDPPVTIMAGSDTIRTGSYLGLIIGESTESTYNNLKIFKDSKGKGITYVNVVSNIFTDVTKLNERLPLYRSVFLDEAKGTDTGVQITFEDNKVKSIFLNSGKQLHQWPPDFTPSSVVVGDRVGTVYRKLERISNINAYRNKFDRISLFTKNVSKDYDPHMTLSPQWFFTTEVEENKKKDVVHLNFKEGVLSSIYINHYQR